MTEKEKSAIAERLQEFELALLNPAARKSREFLSSLLAQDFREFGSSGRIFSKNEIIDALQAETSMQFSIRDFSVDILGDGAALATYRALREAEGGIEIASLRSSIWVLNDGRWQMLFHQGTKIITEGTVPEQSDHRASV